MDKRGTYEVTLTYALDEKSAGAEFEFAVGGQTVTAQLPVTGGWGNYQTLKVGSFALKYRSGLLNATVKPTKKPGEAVMNLREIKLTPTGKLPARE